LIVSLEATRVTSAFADVTAARESMKVDDDTGGLPMVGRTETTDHGKRRCVRCP
jgi:hypothetical protein